MGLLRDWTELNGGVRFRYKIIPFFSLVEWLRLYRWQRQRVNRGWSDRDTWGGGEHIMEVSMGILRFLGDEKNIVDWDWYFKNNHIETYGYKDLHEVAQDLDNYLYWQAEQFGELDNQLEDLPNEHRWAIEYALGENARRAMHFVADNAHGLWW